MPPHDHEGNWYTEPFITSDGIVYVYAAPWPWTCADEPKESWTPSINGGGSFSCNGRIVCSRKKKSRRSDYWRIMRNLWCINYRERRRAARHREKMRREALKCQRYP